MRGFSKSIFFMSKNWLEKRFRSLFQEGRGGGKQNVRCSQADM